MHFAYPPRKSSNPPPFRPRSSRIPTLRKSRLKIIAVAGLAILFLIWLFSGSSSKQSPQRAILGKPPVVIVTVFDEKTWGDEPEYLKNIKDNREEYAKQHGYGTHLVSAGGYELDGAPLSWSKVTAVRHAIAAYPDCKYLWFLEQNAFIMNPSLKVEDYVMNSRNLEATMRKDLPVVPPDSIIRTFSYLKGDDVEFVLTQDKDGLASDSFVLRNGEWAKFFLDTWFDPLYRSYNFQKAETHALEHIVQWHPTILSKLAILPQRLLNSYGKPRHGEVYEDGDLIVRFPGCTKIAGEHSCVAEAENFVPKWREAFKNA